MESRRKMTHYRFKLKWVIILNSTKRTDKIKLSHKNKIQHLLTLIKKKKFTIEAEPKPFHQKMFDINFETIFIIQLLI
jgi:hypothetical protein